MYEFKLREGLRFHNGDPYTAEDVKFSFEPYRGVGARPLHAHVHAVEVVDAWRVRFHLHALWPDFLTFYGTTASTAGFVLPKRYLEQVGEDGFKKPPIGLGAYQFVRYMPGVEVVLEAYAGHWRQVPAVKQATIVEPPADDPQKARQLLVEAGYPKGFDAGEFVPVPAYFVIGSAVANQLHAVGFGCTCVPWSGHRF